MAESNLDRKTFRFSFGKKIYCTSSDISSNVLSALLEDDDFKKIYENKTGKELIIKRSKPHHPAISANFPCCLLENDELLELCFIKDDSENIKTFKTEHFDLKPPQNLVTFLVSTTGNQGLIHDIMKNKNKKLREEVKYVCVVGVKVETIKDALRRDGRFLETLFSKDIGLEDDGKNISKIKKLVDTLKDDKLYSITRISSEAIDDFGDQPHSSSKADSNDSHRHNTISGGQALGEDLPASDKEKTKSKRANKFKIMGNLPGTEEIVNILRAQFESLVKHLKERENVRNIGQVQEVLREEFSKESHCFTDIKIVKQLMDLSGSVCLVLSHDQPIGTGFLLLEKFILTNAHVITKGSTLRDNLSVTFNFEDLITNIETVPLKSEPVAYVRIKNSMDFALMEICLEQLSAATLPPPLLKHYSKPPMTGGVCIIGHPECNVKRMDTCLIIEREKQEQTVEKFKSDYPEYVQLIGDSYFAKKKELDGTQIEYHTCFFYGSSGSPVFNEQCEVVGMHSGGYANKKVEFPFVSIMEYALPLLPILVSILRQTKDKRDDVWQYFSAEKNMEEVIPLAENMEFRPDLTGENIWNRPKITEVIMDDREGD